VLLRGIVVVASVWSFRYGANGESWTRRKSSSFKTGLGIIVLMELLALARFNMLSSSLTSSSAFLPSSASPFGANTGWRAMHELFSFESGDVGLGIVVLIKC
jgi:formate hydrogenlyase subunit 4